jgi:hypothetical protein
VLIAFTPDVVNRADVGVIQRRSGTGFALKPLQCLGIVGDLRGEKLEGYITAEAGILRFVNDTHATATQFLGDAVMRDGLSDLYGSHSLVNVNKDAAVGHPKSILVSFMDYDLGYFDLETRVLEPLDDPFGPRLLPM